MQLLSPNDPALEPCQSQLAEAYLHRSQIVLQKGYINAAEALNPTDIDELRHQLDTIVTDVVNYQCDVSIQAPRTEDYP